MKSASTCNGGIFLPGLFAAIGQFNALKNFENSVDLSRGDKVSSYEEGNIIIGGQEFIPGTIRSIELQDKLLIVHSSINLDEKTLRDLIVSYLYRGELHLLSVVNQCLLSDFSLILYDKRKRRCLALSDPLGIRKIYYANKNGVTLFSSSLPHVLFALQRFKCASSHLLEMIDLKSLYLLLSQGYVGDCKTIFRCIKILPPGQLCVANADSRVEFLKTCRNQSGYVRSNNVEIVHNLLLKSMKHHVEGFKNLSILLSGGVDSSLILSLALRHLTNIQVNAFSTQYEGYSEAEEVKKVIEHLHFNRIHFLNLPVDSEKLMEHFIQSINMLDEPNFKGAFMLRWFTLVAARNENFRTVIVGDGADEIFCGYWANYWNFNKDVKRMLLSKLPREMLAELGLRLPISVICEAYHFSKKDIFNFIRSHFCIDPRFLLHSANEERINSLSEPDDFANIVSRLLYDALLRTDVLTLENFAERLGLIIKFPYLYSPLVDYLFTLPSCYKMVNGYTKFILKALALKYNYLPPEVVVAKKSGFNQTSLNEMLSGILLKHNKELLESSAPVLAPLSRKIFKALNKRSASSVVQYAGLITWLNSLIGRI